MIQSGYTPKKEWLERHFRIELEDKSAGGTAPQQGAQMGPQQAAQQDQQSQQGQGGGVPKEDGDLFNSIFGAGPPAGATPEESQTEAIG